MRPATAVPDGLHLVPLADCAPQPWRNGGGVTRELLRWPVQNAAAGAVRAEDWVLRVSVADITRDGPFSTYAGIDRWFAVIRGAGVRLAVPRGELVAGPGEPPTSFAGEDAPGCWLLGGPTQDLNLMHRRGSDRATMRLVRAGESIAGAVRWRGIYAPEPAQVATRGSLFSLPGGSLLWSDAADAGDWAIAAAGLLYGLDLQYPPLKA